MRTWLVAVDAFNRTVAASRSVPAFRFKSSPARFPAEVRLISPVATIVELVVISSADIVTLVSGVVPPIAWVTVTVPPSPFETALRPNPPFTVLLIAMAPAVSA